MKITVKIFSIFLLVIYSTFVFRVALPLLDYAINYTYITEELCEQKDNPNNECHGSCYLANEIKNQVDTENENGQKIVVSDFVKIPYLVFSQKNQYIKKHSQIIYNQLNLSYLSLSQEPIIPPPKIS